MQIFFKRFFLSLSQVFRFFFFFVSVNLPFLIAFLRRPTFPHAKENSNKLHRGNKCQSIFKIYEEFMQVRHKKTLLFRTKNANSLLYNWVKNYPSNFLPIPRGATYEFRRMVIKFLSLSNLWHLGSTSFFLIKISLTAKKFYDE